MSAIGNDYAYDDIFVRQLENYGQKGDLVLALGVSGNSRNIVKAIQWANENGLETIALVGGKRGEVARIARHVIAIDSVHFGRVEDAQMAICHMLCYAFMENPDWGKA
jgi:D-sedoheptulose 7-phosphate isomerase